MSDVWDQPDDFCDQPDDGCEQLDGCEQADDGQTPITAGLAFQHWARSTLAASMAVTALVPKAHIIDANGRPEVFPCIRLGEDQELPADEVVGRYKRLFATIHLWSREPGLAGVKTIAAAVERALRRKTFTAKGWRCIDTRLDSNRFLRDPDGMTSHGIVVIQATLEEMN